jgi:hypothetical protein
MSTEVLYTVLTYSTSWHSAVLMARVCFSFPTARNATILTSVPDLMSDGAVLEIRKAYFLRIDTHVTANGSEAMV